MQGLKGPADVGARGLAGGRRVGGFVDVIAKVQQKLQVVAGRQGRVSVEEPRVELATGGLGEAQMADAKRRWLTPSPGRVRVRPVDEVWPWAKKQW